MSHEYRCPVCSHADEVVLEGRGGTGPVRCPHCGTDLVIQLRDEDDLTLEVRVAEPGDDEAVHQE
jgi:uncharacterized Zn finger protein